MADTPSHSIGLSLRLTQAMTLARQGQWREAEAALTEGRPLPEDLMELHALAALVTAEGNYLRGLRLWEELRKKDPAHAEAKRMVAAIELWINRPSWARYVPFAAGALGALVLALFLWLTLGSSSSAVTKQTGVPMISAPAAQPSDSVQVQPTPIPPATNTPMVTFPTSKPARRRSH